MRRILPKIIFSILLVSAFVLTGFYGAPIYEENKDEIILELEYFFKELALPIHIMRLSMEDPVEELPVPVYGVRMEDVSDTWGASREEGRTHEGTDIFADRGTPVFSSTPGYVVRTNIGSRGGRNVMVIGPGGLFYYYAHFDRVAEGIRRGVPVTGDSVLGFVGNSGNATGTPTHLHFGIYPEMWDGINPYPMMVDRW